MQAAGVEMQARARNNVRIMGVGARPIMFGHGFGCDQVMWRKVAPKFERDYRVILFDHVGAGESDLSAFNPTKYGALAGYAADVLEIIDELELRDLVFVGHSVSATIGLLAAIERPERFSRLVLVAPSPRYTHDDGYVSGFSESDITDMLELLSSNYIAWSQMIAPTIIGNPDRHELSDELTRSFCRMDPDIARNFARVTFLSDNRADLPRVRTPSLILQCARDVVAPESVGEYMHRMLARSVLVRMKATGHCPNLSAPEETIAAIRAYLDRGAST